MKYTLALLLCVAGCTLGSVLQQSRETGPACPIDDPLEVPAGNINVTLPPLLIIEFGSTHEGGIAVGLSTLFYEYTVNLITLRIDFEITIKNACIAGGPYQATGEIDAKPFRQETIPSGPLVGAGLYEGCVEDFHIKGHVILLVNLITNRLSARVLQIPTFSFSHLAADIGGLRVAGVEIDWAVWNAGIKSNFEQDWATHGTAIVEQIRISANEELKKYTLAELLNWLIGDGSEPATCAPPTIVQH